MRRPAHSLRNRVFTFVGLLVLVSLVGSGWTLVRVNGVTRVLEGLSRSWLGLGRELTHLQNDAQGLRQELEKGLAYRNWGELAGASEQGGRVVSARRFEAPDWLFQSLGRSFDKIIQQVAQIEEGEFSEIRSEYLAGLKSLRGELDALERQSAGLAQSLDSQLFVEARQAYPEWNRLLVGWVGRVEREVSDWERVSRRILEQTRSRIDSLRTGLRLSLLSAVLLSLLLLWLAERALRPLGHLSRLAREITRRGLGREDKELLSQFPLHRGDEVSLLARDFHSMASSLLERERVVQEQTRQLEEQNRELRELNRLRERLREAESLAAIGRLSAQVAHEVRNPLHAIGLEAELAAEKAQALGDPQLKISLQGILESVERLSKITENYLKFSKPSGTTVRRFDLGEALDSVLATYAAECSELGIRVDWERPATPASLEVLADPDAVEQAFGNLMRNAIQALDSIEGGRIHWTLGVAESGRPWAWIRDNGPGIAPAMRAKLFSPFSTNKAQGTGLGLSWVKRVIEEQGGGVEALEHGLAEGEGRMGAGFRVLLARAPEVSPDPRVETARLSLMREASC
jgi:two-component system NtrC family sensor kinase